MGPRGAKEIRVLKNELDTADFLIDARASKGHFFHIISRSDLLRDGGKPIRLPRTSIFFVLQREEPVEERPFRAV